MPNLALSSSLISPEIKHLCAAAVRDRGEGETIEKHVALSDLLSDVQVQILLQWLESPVDCGASLNLKISCVQQCFCLAGHKANILSVYTQQ